MKLLLAILFVVPLFSEAGNALRELASMPVEADENQRQLTMVTYQTIYGNVVTETLTPEQYYQLKLDCVLNMERQFAVERERLAKQQEKEAKKEEKANRKQVQQLERQLEIETIKNEIADCRRKLDRMFFITRNDFERERKHYLKNRIRDLEDQLEKLKKKK